MANWLHLSLPTQKQVHSLLKMSSQTRFSYFLGSHIAINKIMVLGITGLGENYIISLQSDLLYQDFPAIGRG